MTTTRTTTALAALWLALWSALTPTVTAGTGEMPLTFKGKTYSTRNLPGDLTAAQKEAVTRFTPFAEKAEYRMDFDAQGRLLLVTPKGRSRLSDTLRVVGKAETWFDTVLPAPERKATTATPKSEPTPKPSGAPIPEDPESPPKRSLARVPATSLEETTWQSSWGTGSIEPDTQTAVLVIPNSPEDYTSLLDLLAGERQYLKEWLDVARKHTGFTVEDPLTGAFVEGAAGQEEWNADHEVINRVVQLLTLRRFGQQPNWLVQGIAWEAEIAADGLVYCFPFRREFVFAAEHGGWPAEAKNLVKELGGKPVEMSTLCAWRRGTWDGKTAKLAWGVARHLLGQGAGRLSAAMEELRVLRDEKNRRSTGANSWERIPNWEMPADLLEPVLAARFGKDVLKDATTSIRTGRVTVIKEPKVQPRVGVKAR